MAGYLNYHFEDSKDFVNTYDELPLWSAPFGMLLLKQVKLIPGSKVLDIGSGTGFPLLELAGRLDQTCELSGIDPWENAVERVQQKIKSYGITNTLMVMGSAEDLHFSNDHFDLVTSNLGINNIPDVNKAVKECCRVLKPGGYLDLTTNLTGHWQEFYDIFRDTLKQLQKNNLVEKLDQHIAHRGTEESVIRLLANNGFTVTRSIADSFEMRFLNGSAFLNHHFIKMGFMGSWKNILTKEELLPVFLKLEENLNLYALKEGELKLTVPMLFIEGKK